jgi:hypothetical protein
MDEDQMTPAPTEEKLIEREPREPEPARAALVKRWLDDIASARKHWAPDYARMRRNMAFAGGKQLPGQRADDPRYKVNLVQRVLKSTVASLYAKNPTVVHKRRSTLDFKLWDGRTESVVQAQQTLELAAQLGQDPNAAALPLAQQILVAATEAQELLADIQQGVERRKMIDKVGKTLVACLKYYLSEGDPSFKTLMKQMIRRARTTGVGYVKVGFQREMELSDAQQSKLTDHAERLATIGRLTADLQDGELDEADASAAELELAIAAIRSEPEKIVREGLVYSFPKSTSIIPSVSTEKLMGWVGSEWIAEEIMLTPDRIKEVYGVDIGKSFTAYRTIEGSPAGGETRRIADRTKGLACVYHVYDKATGMELVVCEGYPDFLREPGSPPVFIEPFFPVFAITFNDMEDEGRLFPDSDVENLMSPQKEFNRSKEAQRQHRIANRPLYVSAKGSFEEDEVKTLSSYPAHSVIELNGLEKGRPASDLLQPVQKIGIDPNLYETNTIFEDMQRVTGNQEANLGGLSGGTATESSIAESSRQGGLGLDSDDLDDMLTALFRASGQILLTELDAQTVLEIAGQGAVWPELTRAEVAKELWLETKAGSSGRPNQAQEAARFERLAPLLIQVPGVSPRWLAERAILIADDDADLDEAISEGLPSIAAANAVRQLGAGGPNDPNAQGANGSQPQKPQQSRDNGQPGFTAPN